MISDLFIFIYFSSKFQFQRNLVLVRFSAIFFFFKSVFVVAQSIDYVWTRKLMSLLDKSDKFDSRIFVWNFAYKNQTQFSYLLLFCFRFWFCTLFVGNFRSTDLSVIIYSFTVFFLFRLFFLTNLFLPSHSTLHTIFVVQFDQETFDPTHQWSVSAPPIRYDCCTFNFTICFAIFAFHAYFTHTHTHRLINPVFFTIIIFFLSSRRPFSEHWFW